MAIFGHHVIRGKKIRRGAWELTRNKPESALVLIIGSKSEDLNQGGLINKS